MEPAQRRLWHFKRMLDKASTSSAQSSKSSFTIGNSRFYRSAAARESNMRNVWNWRKTIPASLASEQ